MKKEKKLRTKMKKWRIENSEKSEISGISEKLFRVFDFVLLPYSQNRKLGFKNLRKKFRDFRDFRGFRVFGLAIHSKYIDLGLDVDTNIVNCFKKSLSMMMLICIKQHLSNIWSSIQEKVKQHWGWVEKKALFVKKRAFYRENLKTLNGRSGDIICAV